MNSSRISYILIGTIFISFLILTAFNAMGEISEIRTFINEKEMPALGIAAYSRLNNTAAYYKRAGEHLLEDDFLRDWITGGEEDYEALSSFMVNIRDRYGLLDASLVSDLTETYYGTDGRVLKLSPENAERDGWYYHYRENVGESNIDSWFYPESGIIGLYVNIPVRDRAGMYLGVTGGGVDSAEFDMQLKSFEHDWELSLYMVRNDGRLVYSTEGRLLEPPAADIDKIWAAPVMDRISREKQNPEGVVINPGGKSGPVLWAGYMPEWETFLIIERRSEVMVAELRSTLLGALIPESLLAIALFIISIAALQYLFRRAAFSASSERKYFLRFQSVIYIQNALLKKAETDLSGHGNNDRCNSLRAGREALKILLSSEEEASSRVQVNIHEIIHDLLIAKSSEFQRRRINLHSRLSSTKFIVPGNDALFGLLLEELIDTAAAATVYDSEIVLLTRNRQNSIAVDIAFSMTEGTQADFDISPLGPVFDTLRIAFSMEQRDSRNCIFHLEF